MTPPEAVVVVGAGLLQVPLIQEAQAMGFQVIVIDQNPAAPGIDVADDFMYINTYRADICAFWTEHKLRPRYTLRGVCTAGADVAPTVAAIAHAVNLPGIPVEVAERTHNKHRVRRTLERAGLACYQPMWDTWDTDYVSVLGVTEPAVIAESLGYPCVIKPLSQRASRGISIVRHGSEMPAACDKALQYGTSYLIEECLTGTEHSAEALFDTDGTLAWFNVVDRFFDYTSGVPLETGHVNPSRLSPMHQQQVQLMAVATARALGVTWGPYKMDVLFTEDGPKLLECTARLSGGFDCQRTSPLTGRHPMRQLLQLACGLPVERQGPAKGFAACAAILPQQVGIVTSLPVEQGILWAIAPGQQIAPAQHNGERAGYVIAAADDYHVAWGGALSMAEACATFLDTTLLPLPT